MKRLLFSSLSIPMIVSFLFLACSVSTSSGGGSKPVGVSIDKEELLMVVGDTATLTATVTPDNDSVDVYWDYDFDDYSIATVGFSSGLVTANGEGTMTITASAYINGKEYTDTCLVIVTERAPIEITEFGFYKTAELTSSLSEIWFHATVTPEKHYLIFMDDASEGSGAYTLDAYLYTYRADKSTTYYNASYIDDAYDNPPEIVIPTGETDLYLRVRAEDYSSNGTFAVGISELADSGDIDVTIE